MLRHDEYQHAIARGEQRLEELRKVRDGLLKASGKKSLSTSKQIEWASEMIELIQLHLQYLRLQLALHP